MDESAVFDLFRASEAMLEGHFELSSGLHSDRYFQCARLLMDPARAEQLAKALRAKIETPIDVVVGPAMGAVTWAHEVARAFGVRAMFTERVDGGMALRRGFRFEPRERVLVVEDVVTTGGSAREVLALLRQLGGNPVHMGAVLNRSGCNPFEVEGLELASLAAAKVEVWKPDECPLCAEGGKAIKPGSRPGSAEVGSPTA